MSIYAADSIKQHMQDDYLSKVLQKYMPESDWLDLVQELINGVHCNQIKEWLYECQQQKAG